MLVHGLNMPVLNPSEKNMLFLNKKIEYLK